MANKSKIDRDMMFKHIFIINVMFIMTAASCYVYFNADNHLNKANNIKQTKAGIFLMVREVQHDYKKRKSFDDLGKMPVEYLTDGRMFWANTYGAGAKLAKGVVGKEGGLADPWGDSVILKKANGELGGIKENEFEVNDFGKQINANECKKLSMSVGDSAIKTVINGVDMESGHERGEAVINEGAVEKACTGGSKPITWVFGH